MRAPSARPAADLFQEGWSRNRGRRAGGSAGPGAQLARASQMVRAAQGYRPAVFKAIRRGGCQTGADLARQLAYLTTKSSHVFDAYNAYDGQSVLTPAQRDELVARFERAWDPARQTKLGHTSHLLMSFPIGTKAEAVREVARDVCAQFFQGDGAHFDYVVAVHEDRAHTHAHIVVNRHSPDGEMFYLRAGHHYSYELFREAMVEHGDRHGLRLEATRRVDRGLVTFEPRSIAVQQAREAGVVPDVRERDGRDRERALRHIRLASSTYQGLAAAASRDGFERVSEALLRASLTLARNGVVLPAREITMADTQGSFDGLVKEFSRHVQALEDRIATVPPAERPRLEHGLTEALASVAQLNPLGEDSGSLREAPSTDGVYSRARIEADALARLDEPRVRSALDTALQGTGLNTSEVLARVRIGANNAALESHWHAHDVRTVAATLGADATRPDAQDRALDRLEAAYDKVEGALREVGVLREQTATAEEGEVRRVEAELAAAQDVRAVTHPAQRADERAAPIVDGSLEPIQARLQAILSRPDGRAAGRDRLTAPVALEGDEDGAGRLSRRTTDDDRLLEAVAARLRDEEPTTAAFSDDAEAQAFRTALDRRLDADERAQLARGEEDALVRVAADRIDRLNLAKAYLETDPATQRSPVHIAVLDKIVDEQAELHAARAGHKRGLTHG